MTTDSTDSKPDDRTLAPLAGLGLLARYGDLVLLFAAPETEDDRTAAVLDAIASTAASAGADGRKLGRQLAGLLLQHTDFPALAAFGPAGEGIAVIVHGAAQVLVVTDDGELVLDGRDAVTWVDRIIPAPARVIRGGLGTLDGAELDRWSRLDAGVVRAGGFVFGPPSAEGGAPTASPGRTPGRFASASSAGDASEPTPPPAPLIRPVVEERVPSGTAPYTPDFDDDEDDTPAPTLPRAEPSDPVPSDPVPSDPVPSDPEPSDPVPSGATPPPPPVASPPAPQSHWDQPAEPEPNWGQSNWGQPAQSEFGQRPGWGQPPAAEFGQAPPAPEFGQAPPAPEVGERPGDWPPPPALAAVPPLPPPPVSGPPAPFPQSAPPASFPQSAPPASFPQSAPPASFPQSGPPTPPPLPQSAPPAPSWEAAVSPPAWPDASPAAPAVAPAPELPLPDEASLQPASAPPAGPAGVLDRDAPFEAVLLIGDEALEKASQTSGPLPPADVQPPPGPVPADGAEEADARPIVLGIYCRNEHFNDPRVPYCAVCGVSMAQQAHVSQTGPRPPLGLLVLDDGATFRLDTAYVVGREPERDEAVLQGRARALRIDDPKGVVSRIHARVELDGWDVTVVDLASANGTHIAPPNSDAWTRLEPHRPIVLTPGTRVVFGRRGFRYESHRNP